MHSVANVLQAAEAVENGAPVPASLETFLGAGPSAGGARPKAAVRDDGGALWLAKFPARGDTFDVARAEACTLALARRCGLTVPEVRHLDLGGRSVMLIRRFYRYWVHAGQRLPEGAQPDTRPGEGRTGATPTLCDGTTPCRYEAALCAPPTQAPPAGPLPIGVRLQGDDILTVT